jgi:hypothetical protein
VKIILDMDETRARPEIIPPPWTCKGDVYICGFWNNPSQGAPIIGNEPGETSSHNFRYELERDIYAGGPCVIQLIRYTESPVGSYDELLIIPGYFRQYNSPEMHPRITRIYVSQHASCLNGLCKICSHPQILMTKLSGRQNWNIPK